jgi:large subunit ribosomal protein L28
MFHLAFGNLHFGQEEQKVSKVCDICGKKPMTGHNVSHSHKLSKRRWLPNLQKVKVKVEGGGTKTMRVCASCIRSNKIVKAG